MQTKTIEQFLEESASNLGYVDYLQMLGAEDPAVIEQITIACAKLFSDQQVALNGNWNNVSDGIFPALIDGQNYSQNVYVIINGHLGIGCYCYISGEDGGFIWANCYGKIDGDCEFDDEYEVTQWQPLPILPSELQPESRIQLLNRIEQLQSELNKR